MLEGMSSCFTFAIFADDSIIFSRALPSDIETMKNILMNYELAFGQKISMEKSVITFSPNVDATGQETVLSFLGLKKAQSHDKYLGFEIWTYLISL